METISPPLNTPPVDYRIRCSNRVCNAVMLCRPDELRLEHDDRESSALVMICPHCRRETWSAVDGYLRMRGPAYRAMKWDSWGQLR